MNNRYDDLVLHLKLDDIDISTNMLSDSSKSGLKAKVNGASLVEDDTFGACLNFERQDDHVEISSLDLTGANPPHTIEGWIKVQAYPEKAKSFILLLGQADEHSHHWLLNSETAGDLGKKAQLGHWGLESLHAKPIIPLAEWVHLATTFDGLNYVCYLNGQAIDRHQHYKFTLTDKRLTLAESANLRESARVRGIATEKNFQGKMAHVRIYRRALSEAEIREDIDTDRLALAAFRRGHPIGFSLSDKDENYVLYIGDDPRDHHRLNLELRNTSAQAISFQKQGDTASRDNHHFELVFRNGVLSDKTLNMLRENKDKDRIVPEKNTDAWDVFSPGEDNQSGTVSVYFLYKEKDKEETKGFGPGERLTIPLRKISANAGSGARGTRVELKLNQLTYVDETTPITGSRIQHLQIISHLGSRRAPLHVGFVGSNRILNDGSSANTLVLQLMNVLKSEGDTSATYTTLTSTFTMPAVNGTAVASVASGGAAQFNVGRIVYIPPIGYLNVTAVNTASNQLTLQNLGYSVNQAPGSVAPSGNTLLTKDSESTVTLTKESEFLISFDVQSASEDAPWSLCTEGEIKGVKGSIIVAKTDGRYVVIDQNGNAVGDVGRWKVDSTGHGQGETPVWSIKPREDIFLGHDDYIQIYISNIKTSLPSGPTNLYLDYRHIPGFWDGQVVCPIEKAPLLFYGVTCKQAFSFPQGEYFTRYPVVFQDIPRPYLSSEERDRLVSRLEGQRRVHETARRLTLQSLKIRLLDGQLKKEAEHFFNEWERLAALSLSVEQRVAQIPKLLAVTASRRYIELLDNSLLNRTLYVSPDLPGAALPAKGFANPETIDLPWGGRDWRQLRMSSVVRTEWASETFPRHPLELRLAADMVEIEEDATEPAKDSVEGVITPAEEHSLAEAKKSLREIAALLNEIETQRAQLHYTGELRVGIGCVKPEAKLEIALAANDADTKPLVIRKDKVNYLTVLKDGKVGIGTSSPQTQLHVGSGSWSSSSINTDRVNMVVASESKGAGIAIAQKSGVNVVLQAWDHPGSPHGGDGYIGTTSNHSLFLMTNNQQNVVINTDGKVGIGTLNPSARLSIMGGLNVGGESDPGDKNLLVGGKASITGGLQVGRELGDEGAPFTSAIRSSALFVNGRGFFFGDLDVANNIGFLYHPAKHFVARIAVEPDGPLSSLFLPVSGNFPLVFKTCRDAKLHNSITVQPPGGDAPTLNVAGYISEKLDLIELKGHGDKWTLPDHPIMKYFSKRLTGKPVGTMLRAITDLPDWRGHYWQGWVDADRNIRVIHNQIKTPHIAPKEGTSSQGVVVYAD